LKAEIELKRIMKAKLQTALKSNVDPLFFALSCALLICTSFTAKVLADDVLGEVTAVTDNMMMTADGQFVTMAE
jgi:hypothetical protein